MKALMCRPEKEVVEVVSAKENDATLKRMVKDWNLGPLKASSKPGDNKDFWIGIAKVWNIKEDEARRQVCANCEYFNNTPEAMKAMDKIPFNAFDADGGGRGYCVKFDFICHNLRTCMAWERKDFEQEE